METKQTGILRSFAARHPVLIRMGMVCLLFWGGCRALNYYECRPSVVFPMVFGVPPPPSVRLISCHREFQLTESIFDYMFHISPSDLESILGGAGFLRTESYQPWNRGETSRPFSIPGCTPDKIYWNGGNSVRGYALYYDSRRGVAYCTRMSH